MIGSDKMGLKFLDYNFDRFISFFFIILSIADPNCKRTDHSLPDFSPISDKMCSYCILGSMYGVWMCRIQ